MKSKRVAKGKTEAAAKAKSAANPPQVSAELGDDELANVSGGSNVRKTRQEISMTFARNARG